ncbi:hypothetical protein JCM8202_002985 [Rhodotorula sphaerocarpa]
MFAAALVASFAASAAFAAPVPAPVELTKVNATHNATAYYYYQHGRAGACGEYSQDSDLVVGLPLEFYTNYDAVSPYCGDYVVVQGVNKNITARVADASTLNSTMTFSIGAWDALNASATDLSTVQWRFANVTEAEAAKKAAEQQPTSSVAAPASTRSAAPKKEAPASSSSSAAWSSTTSTWVAPSSSAKASTSTWTPSSSAKASASTWTPSSSSSSEWVAPSSSSSEWVAPSSSSSSEWVAPSSSSSSEWVAPSSSSTSEWVAPTTTTTSEWVAPTTTSQWVAPTTTTTTWVAPTTTTTTSQWVAPTTTQAPAPTQQASNANSGGYSGRATFYSQNGNAGSCGQYHSDSDYIIALPYGLVDGGAHCGQSVWIRNTQNGKSINAVVADTCPGCGGQNIDLSKGAFGALGAYSQGVLPINWGFN